MLSCACCLAVVLPLHAFLCLNVFWLFGETNAVVTGQPLSLIPSGSLGGAKLRAMLWMCLCLPFSLGPALQLEALSRGPASPLLLGCGLQPFLRSCWSFLDGGWGGS